MMGGGCHPKASLIRIGSDGLDPPKQKFTALIDYRVPGRLHRCDTKTIFHQMLLPL